MLNPSEIANQKFDKVMGRGYRIDEVENFLRQVASDYSALLEEKQEIEQKIIVLADKLEEYKRDEESMRSALIGAQKLGDSVIRDAKAKASAIIDEAGGRAQLLLDNARMTIEREQVGYARLQREVAAFKSKLQHLYKQHLEMISSIPGDDSQSQPHLQEASQGEPIAPPTAPQAVQMQQPAPVPPPQPQSQPQPQQEYIPEEPIYEEPVQEYQEPMMGPEEPYHLPAEQPQEYQPEIYEPEPLPTPAPAPVPEEKPSRFGTLKFGREYTVSRTDKRKK